MQKNKLSYLLSLILMIITVTAQAQSPLPEDSATVFIENSTTLYTKVDSMPRYPGGKAAWMKFLVKTLRYPVEAQDQEIMGETRISFIVDVDGTISEITPVMGDPVLTKESVRLIEQSGKWLPAIYQQRKVKAYHIQPISYKLEFDHAPRKKKRK